MKKTIACMAIAALSSTANAQTLSKAIEAQDSHIEFVGRTSKKDPKEVKFTFPGVNFSASFTGTSVAMKVKPGSGYFMVELDKQKPFKVLSTERDSIIILSESLNEGNHHLRVMYAQEGYEQKPAFRGLLIDKDATMLDNSHKDKHNRRIEFIGNSITCGYGVEAMDPNEHFSYSTENHYYTYAAITARELHADELVVSRSGIGIYKNYGSPITGSKGFSMPDKYELTLFTDNAVTEEMERWDHSLYTPDVVCLNLGTNDTSQDTYDTKLLKKAYIDFVKHLRNTYPNAKIVLLCGSMMNGKALEDCKEVLNQVKEEIGDSDVYRFDFTPHNGSLGYGADWHPSVRQQRKMADELIPFIQKITGWSNGRR